MPEAVGLLILGGLDAAGVGGAAAFGTATVLGISGATAVGGATLLGATIGLQYALSNPNVPAPQQGAQPLKQAVPPRIRGYWINRLAGYYVLFLAAGGNSQDMIAFHSGRIEQVIQLYLHDNAPALTPTPTDGTIVTVDSIDGITYTGPIEVQFFYGTDTQDAASGLLNVTSTAGVWTPNFHGRGIACMAMFCTQAANPTSFTKIYPQGLPLPSVVAKCAPVWDPRDGTQSRSNPLTWRASPNPVLQLIDYLTLTDGGMGEDIDDILPPAVLAQWMIEADLCDAVIDAAPSRYQCAFWYQFDNSPENVIAKMLAACDGWLAEAGDGTLTLTVGYYREPTDTPITGDQIIGWSVQYGLADENVVNELDVTYTNPFLGYLSDQIQAVRDEASISLTGIVRSKPLDLTSVQDPTQAQRLSERAILSANPAMTGTLVTTLYGLRYLGRRWVKVQFPIINGLADCVVEIQDQAQVDLLAGTVTFNWNLVDVAALEVIDNIVPTPPPTVTGISPNTGTNAGGTSVTITGMNFTGASAATFGGAAATGMTVVSSSSITAMTPAHAVGAVDVAVTTLAGTGIGGTLFTYVLPPPALLREDLTPLLREDLTSYARES